LFVKGQPGALCASSALLATFGPWTFFRYFPMSYQIALGRLDMRL